jgi:hypothetical protein
MNFPSSFQNIPQQSSNSSITTSFDYVSWFEQLVTIQLAKSPNETTRILEEFRENENVFEITLAILQSPLSSHQGKFHSISCLQYALLLKWETLSTSDQQQWLSLLETFIFQSVSSNFPSYLINKLIQVFCSIHKKKWISSTIDQKKELFQWLSRFFSSETNGSSASSASNTDNSASPYTPTISSLMLGQLGITIISSLLEEFMKKSSADLGIHGNTYLQRKVDFETVLLPYLFVLIMEQYGKQLDFYLSSLLPSLSSSNATSAGVGGGGGSGVAAAVDPSLEEPIVAFLLAILKCLIEMITWEYGETHKANPHYAGDMEGSSNNNSSGSGRGEGGAGGSASASLIILKPPKYFHDYLISFSFIEKNYTLYHSIKKRNEELQKQHSLQIKQQKQAKKAGSTGSNNQQGTMMSMTLNHASQASYYHRIDQLNNCLLELRNLFLSLSLINGEIFINDSTAVVNPSSQQQQHSEKIEYGNLILSLSYQLAQPYLSRNSLSLLTFDAVDYLEGDIRYQELSFFISLFHHFIANYSFSLCLTMSYFQHFLSFLTSIALEISKELSLLTNDMTVMLLRSNYQDITTSAGGGGGHPSLVSSPGGNGSGGNGDNNNIFQTWRFDLLYNIFDIFIIIHDEFILSFNSASTSSSSSNAVASLKSYLMEVSKELFPLIFEIIIVIFVNDSLLSIDEEEQEDEERIISRNLDTFFIGLSSLGRFSIFHSLSFLGQYLSSIFHDFQNVAKIYTPAGGQVAIDHSIEMKTLFCLEKIRLCILILSFLLIDNFSLGNTLSSSSSAAGDDKPGSGGSGGGSPGKYSSSLLLYKTSSDINIINDWILNAISSDNLMTLQCIIECFKCVSIIYQFMMTLLSSSSSVSASSSSHNPCVSPYLLQTILYFYSELFNHYLSPNSENYSIEMLEKYPFLQTLFKDGKKAL